MAELGRIERPDVDSFKGKRKLYCVNNVYFLETDDDLKILVDRFWDETSSHIDRLERAGKIKKIFFENIYSDKEGLEMIKRLNEKVFNIINKKIDEGAVLLPLEREEIFGPYIDWANCLTVVKTKEVFEKVYEFYKDFYDRRIKYIQNLIETNLLDGESGLLIMRDEDRMKVQLSTDIEIFLVTPPSYDDILKWIRKRMDDLKREKNND